MKKGPVSSNSPLTRRTSRKPSGAGIFKTQMTEKPTIPDDENDPLTKLLVQMGLDYIFNPTHENTNPRSPGMDVPGAVAKPKKVRA
jgi:hypothetical protein